MRAAIFLAVATGVAGAGETTYSEVQGECRVAWIVADTELNRAVIRHRSECSLPLAGQVPIIAKIMHRVLVTPADYDRFHTLDWGRLHPDGHPDPTMAMRLALAARRSPQWDAVLGRPRTGDINGFVRKLANDALIYAELRDMFRAAGLEIRVAAVEKVLVLRARQLPFFDRLGSTTIKPADKVPYDCMTWFSISKAGR